MRSKVTGKELALPGWREAAEAGWLAEWALSLMLMNVATRKFGRAVRLAETGSGLSKSAVSRRFKALTEARLAEWMGFGPVAVRPFGDPDRRAPYDRQAADDRRRRH